MRAAIPQLAELIQNLGAEVAWAKIAKGVLSEGDRRGAKQSAAPPLTSPVGRLLFGEPIERLRAQGADGRPLSETALVRDWRAVRRLCRDYRARAASGR